jgi:hypothetical protein
LNQPKFYRRPATIDLEKAPAKIAGIIRAITHAHIGQRNQLCFWGACRLAELADQQIISQDDAIDIIVEVASRVGLPYNEALRTARSAFNQSSGM